MLNSQQLPNKPEINNFGKQQFFPILFRAEFSEFKLKIKFLYFVFAQFIFCFRNNSWYQISNKVKRNFRNHCRASITVRYHNKPYSNAKFKWNIHQIFPWFCKTNKKALNYIWFRKHQPPNTIGTNQMKYEIWMKITHH